MILKHFSYIGVLTLELFDVSGVLYANEMAPRVHNSGHWSIEGSFCSQFENHIRAITGDQLKAGRVRVPSVMLNVIGSPPERGEIFKNPNVHLHLYGKSSAPKRKIGHITVTESDFEKREKLVEELGPLLSE